MKFALGLVIFAVAATPALAVVGAPAPELATGLPAVVAVIGTFVATRLARRK